MSVVSSLLKFRYFHSCSQASPSGKEEGVGGSRREIRVGLSRIGLARHSVNTNITERMLNRDTTYSMRKLEYLEGKTEPGYCVDKKKTFGTST